jgi:hypothetical protein
MISKWESQRSRATRGAKISGEKKLEGIRLMNELADKILTPRQKSLRRKFKQS